MIKAQQKQSKVLLIGDVCIDRYSYVTSTRTNPENGTPIYKEVYQSADTGGMSLNVYEGLLNLGLDVEYKRTFPAYYSTKTRMIDNNTMQPLFRFDEDVESKEADLSNIDLLKYQAIVISDYGKGFVSDATIKYIMGAYMGYGQIFLDTKKKDLNRYSGCVIKINQAEALASTSLPYTNLIVTLGEDGATFNGYTQRGMRVNCIDPCGAGDAFLAGLVYGYFQQERQGVLAHTSVEYAMVNAALSVKHHGVYAPNLEELEQGMTDYYEQKFR